MLSAAENNGISAESSGYSLLENWLERRPDASLMEVWEAFIVDFCAESDPLVRDALRNELMNRARGVAEAAGGFLGLGSKTSAVEEAVLVRLEKAFQA